jgi:HAD superfamily phosphoserine phosphatase-like hydrolase
MFVDFDGTITDRDTFDVLVKLFAGEETWEETERGLDAGTRSLRDVLASQAALVRGEFRDVAAILRREIRVDPAFPAFAHACRERGVPLQIVSSGVASIVRDRMHEFGLDDLPIVANEVDPRPEGWVLHFRDPVSNGTDKAAIVRAARADGKRTVFIGDGRSDYDAAREADVRFAKRGLPLEAYLTERSLPFEAYQTFAGVYERCVALGIL